MVRTIAAALALWSVASSALACDADTDCKGDRICVEQQCVDPNGAYGEPMAGDRPAPIPEAEAQAEQPPALEEATREAESAYAEPPRPRDASAVRWSEILEAARADKHSKVHKLVHSYNSLLISGGVLLAAGITGTGFGLNELTLPFGDPSTAGALIAGGALFIGTGTLVMALSPIPRAIAKQRFIHAFDVSYVPPLHEGGVHALWVSGTF